MQGLLALMFLALMANTYYTKLRSNIENYQIVIPAARKRESIAS